MMAYGCPPPTGPPALPAHQRHRRALLCSNPSSPTHPDLGELQSLGIKREGCLSKTSTRGDHSQPAGSPGPAGGSSVFCCPLWLQPADGLEVCARFPQRDAVSAFTLAGSLNARGYRMGRGRLSAVPGASSTQSLGTRCRAMAETLKLSARDGACCPLMPRGVTSCRAGWLRCPFPPSASAERCPPGGTSLLSSSSYCLRDGLSQLPLEF